MSDERAIEILKHVMSLLVDNEYVEAVGSAMSALATNASDDTEIRTGTCDTCKHSYKNGGICFSEVVMEDVNATYQYITINKNIDFCSLWERRADV